MQPKPALTVLLVLLLLLSFSGFAWQVRAQEPNDPAWFQQQGDRFFQERKLEKAGEAGDHCFSIDGKHVDFSAGLSLKLAGGHQG